MSDSKETNRRVSIPEDVALGIVEMERGRVVQKVESDLGMRWEGVASACSLVDGIPLWSFVVQLSNLFNLC